MKKKALLISIIITTCMISAASAVDVASPDGKVKISLTVKDFEGAKACAVYSVSYKNKTLVNDSLLGLELKDGAIGEGLEIVKQSQRSSDTTWKPVYGQRSIIRDNYNEAVVHLKENSAPNRLLTVTLRAYDEGVAFCYTIPKQVGLDSVTISKELTQFRLAGDYAVWAVYSAQGKYEKVNISLIKRGCERPLVIEAEDDLYIALAEARMVDYARMKFAPLGRAEHSLVSDLSSSVEAKLPVMTPWRVVMVGDSPGQLLENNYIILNLNSPCAIEDTSWIKPGKVIREVTLTTAGGKACVDFAVEHNLQYVEYDAGWYGPENSNESDATTVTVDPQRSKGPLNLQEVIKYADQHGIGIIVYVNHRALEKQLDEILPLYQKWGIKGIKYGFVNVGTQQWTKWMHEAIIKTARHKIMVDVHDEYRPTGWSRTYPNFMTQEGIRGDEERQENSMALTTLFTRMIAGAGDNTICYYNERVDQNASHAYQLAKAVCFYSPWQFLFWYDRPSSSPKRVGGAGDSETGIGSEPEIEFFEHCPTVWDETKVIQGSIGQYAIIARQSGDNWFIGCMNNQEKARSFDVPLGFLDKGRKYTAHIYSDDKTVNTRTHVRIDKKVVDSDTVLKVTMQAKCGQAVRIVPD